MKQVESVLIHLSDHYYRPISVLGAVSGWASFDLLRASQIAAAILASLVSICSIILIAPKVIGQVKRWCSRK